MAKVKTTYGELLADGLPGGGTSGHDMVDWDCPACGEENSDLIDQGTHCAYCGEVVWVGNQDNQVWDEGWKVESLHG